MNGHLKEDLMKLLIRKAAIKDAVSIHSLVNKFARKDEMLPRSLNEIYENIRDFFICADDRKIVGTSAIHILWENLAEIRSVAVLKEYQNKNTLPQKIWGDCLKCPKFPKCEEVAVMKTLR